MRSQLVCEHPPGRRLVTARARAQRRILPPRGVLPHCFAWSRSLRVDLRPSESVTVPSISRLTVEGAVTAAGAEAAHAFLEQAGGVCAMGDARQWPRWLN